jgi:glucose-6-phosphate 1-epimerase
VRQAWHRWAVISLDGPPTPPTPCTPVRIRAGDGARLVACAHGGQVLGWSPACDDRERLWLSPLARCGDGESIRGGVPVMFPQFARRGSLPPHGLARDRTWELDTGSDGAPAARLACRLRDDARTRAVWPHPFTLTLVAEAAGPRLTLTLGVRNEAPVGGEPFTLTAALHAYLAADVPASHLHGLDGAPAEDNAAGSGTIRLPDGPLPAAGPIDVTVRGARGPVRLVTDGVDDLEVRCPGKDGFDSLVVWNPGERHGLADVPPGGTDQFVCVQPARLSPVTIEPQGVWHAVARLTALVPPR